MEIQERTDQLARNCGVDYRSWWRRGDLSSPMKLLDPHRFDQFVQRHFGHPGAVDGRRVGKKRQYAAPYLAIRHFFGDTSLRPELIAVVKELEPYALLDDRIAQFSYEIQRYLRTEGRLFDGPPATHLVNEQYDSDCPRLIIQPCDYSLQAGSCFALDLVHPLFHEYGGTLRDYYFQRQRATGVNPLPQCLGVCGFLVADDRYGPAVLVVRRSATVASYDNSIGPSVAGSIDFPVNVSALANLLVESLAVETAEEIGMSREDISISPLAIARELYRGERPQMFGLIETRMSMEEVLHSLTQTGSSEIADCRAIPLKDGSLPSEIVATFNPEAQMAWYLCEEYLDWRKS
jgi:hypothetical protein